MKPEQQRIAIAEACGWTEIEIRSADWMQTILSWVNPCPDKGDDSGSRYVLPNYPADLNACHEMEKVLTPSQAHEYIGKMSDMTGGSWTDGVTECPRVVFATAAQRAEAFLRTLNLWTE